MITIRFLYLTDLKRPILRNARLVGSWDGWVETPMQEIVAADGCPAFTATVRVEDDFADQQVHWGVRVDGPAWSNVWAIPTEVADLGSVLCHRDLQLPGAGGSVMVSYHLTNSRFLGAQKVYSAPGADPDLVFSVWAPNATLVEVVFGLPGRGYIAEDRPEDIDTTKPVVPLHPSGGGVWVSELLTGFAAYAGVPYMFRVTTGQGHIRYRGDMYSRWQFGRGQINPASEVWDGARDTLDGVVSCSVVIDQDVVRSEFEPSTTPPALIGDEEFWLGEFTPGRPVPTRVEDLVIYELHVASLGFDHGGPGTLADAMRLVDYLDDLGVNAVELMPLAEFSGSFSWGYGNTFPFTIESSAGGRDKFKHFVRACHQRGIAVIQDVVYNHFDNSAERAEWMYDCDTDEQNPYYWYEGRSDGGSPHGYLENGSSGAAPRYHEAMVRQMFTSSAAELLAEFHIDGFRVDLTQAIHADNRLRISRNEAISIGSANIFGQKLLREWNRTLRLIRPTVMLMAEDHSGWGQVTQPPGVGGLGFDALWYAEFYHHLIGDTSKPGQTARLLREAGFGDDRPLAMGWFADQLGRTQYRKVAYIESHDEAGNHREGEERSARTPVVAVNHAPLIDLTRGYAEARSRVVAGLSMLSAGTPMFFMGEEIVAAKPFVWDGGVAGREDLHGERAGAGARMFHFYQDLIGLRLGSRAVRSSRLEVVHVNDNGRILAFTRGGEDGDQVLVVASLNNHGFTAGYVIQSVPEHLAAGMWQEVFNSDSAAYGGANVGNAGAMIPVRGGRLEMTIPANGLLVLQRR